MAQRFIMSNPPRFPIALSYGESFPSFLRTQCRVASPAAMREMIENTLRLSGRLDILVNNAGI
jgi:NADP-dependent 3-hydroxy acid dehydrogenase YdfG